MRTCCTWETFVDGFHSIWDRATSPAPPRLLIDWDLAKRHWLRYAMTGGEAAKMQLVALSDEGLYLHLGRHRPDADGNDGGPGTPAPIKPSPCPTLVWL